MSGALLVLTQILPLVPSMIQGVVGAAEAYNHGMSLFNKLTTENRDPTFEELEELRKRVNKANEELQKL